MSVNISVSLRVSLEDMAAIQSGKAASRNVEFAATNAVAKKLRSLQFQVTRIPYQDESFQVWVKTLTGKNFPVNVTGNTTTEELAGKIQDIEGIPPDQQGLAFKGQQMWAQFDQDPDELGERATRTLDSVSFIALSVCFR